MDSSTQTKYYEEYGNIRKCIRTHITEMLSKQIDEMLKEEMDGILREIRQMLKEEIREILKSDLLRTSLKSQSTNVISACCNNAEKLENLILNQITPSDEKKPQRRKSFDQDDQNYSLFHAT